MEPLPPPAIDLSEKFEHLNNAAIKEAVIELRAPAVSVFGEASVKFHLKNELPEYPLQDSLHTAMFQFQIQVGTGQNEAGEPISPKAEPASPTSPKNKPKWDGVRARSEDGRQTAFFKPTSFMYSLQPPYSEWNAFSEEALRLWEIHKSIARVEQIQRVGVRYINRIPMPGVSFELSDYMTIAPPDPKGIALPFVNFLHQDTFMVPGHPYQINCTRTILPITQTQNLPNLVIDIDVFTTAPVSFSALHDRLAEMRWLKNKLFFGIVTEKTLSILR